MSLFDNDGDNTSIISEHFIRRLDRTYSPYCLNKDNFIEEREENYKTIVYNRNGQKFRVLSSEPTNVANYRHDQGQKPEILSFEVRIHPKYPVQQQILKTTVVVPPPIVDDYAAATKKRPSMSRLEKPNLSLANKVDQNNNDQDPVMIKTLNFDRINQLIDDQDIARAIRDQKFFDDEKNVGGKVIRVERLTVSTLL